MRTVVVLQIATALGLALTGVFFWHARYDRDASLDAMAPPPVGSLLDATSRKRGRIAPHTTSRERERIAAPPGRDATRSESAQSESAPDPGSSRERESPARFGRQHPSFEAVRATLAETLAAHLPDAALQATELDDLADVVLRQRHAQAELRKLPKTREYAERRARERRRLEEAISDFVTLLGMTPGEFTRLVQPAVGISDPNSAEGSGEVLIRPIRPQDESE